MKKDQKGKDKKNLLSKFLNGIETVGNKLPHPVTIFALLCLAIIIISEICARAGVSVDFSQINRKTKEIEQITVEAIGLLNPEGIRYMVSSAVTNFTGFAPLGTVLVAMLGVGVAEGTGLISAALRKLVLSTPKRLITIVVVFAGIMSNIASDAGYVVLVPLGALVFLSFGRHPIAGLAAAFAGVSGGFSANLLIGTIDPLLAGLSTEAAKIVDPNYVVQPTANFFFMFVSTFVIAILGTFVTEKIIEPRLGEYKGEGGKLEDVSDDEKRGLKYALISIIAFTALILFMVVPADGILRNPENGSILSGSPFMEGIVTLIFLFFLIPGVFYGIGAKSLKSDKDIVKAMSKGMSTMGGYLVLVFVAAQFVNYFNYTNLGTIVAVNGANILKSTGFLGIPLIITFIIVAAFINLFMGSASAKWAIMAPIFIPMFMEIGISPELTQVAYRIGDSSTNIISPLMSYFALIIAFAEQYDKESGIGTIISTMVPYSIVFLIGWSIMLIIWYYLRLPLGPGAPIDYVVSMLSII